MRMAGIFLLLLVLCGSLPAATQWDRGTERSQLVEAAMHMRLPEAPVLPGSVRVKSSNRVLQENVDFRVDIARATILLLDESLIGSTLEIRWQVLRLDLPPLLSLYPDSTLARILPGVTGDSLVLARLPERETIEEGRLQYSGSFLRGISVGSGGQVGLESGLQLRIEGQVGRNVNVEAYLSDRDTPIQPEGRSQSLEEIDRIHVRVWSPRWYSTMGDFDLKLQGGKYLNYERTVDGIEGGYLYQGNAAGFYGALARGRQFRMEFAGQEGVQGPWQLRSESGQEDIVVLAGSERVWLDGLALRRGENQDYTIDYGLGRLHFTTRRPITADSRIAIEYQYSERVFNRRLLGAHAAYRTEQRWLELAWASEADDPDNPLDQFLDDADRSVLAGVGDRTEEALGSGIREVDPGEGSYRLLNNSGQWGTFEFAENPPDSLADEFRWDLRFTDLGLNPMGQLAGDYERHFTDSGRPFWSFVGIHNGRWAPVIPLEAPTSHSVLGLDSGLRFGKVELRLQGGFSQQDQNLYSSLDDEDNQGGALQLQLSAKGNKSFPLGQPGFNLKLASEQARFKSFRQLDEVEYEREWGVSRSASQNTGRADLELALNKNDSLRQKLSLHFLHRGPSDSRVLKIKNRLMLGPLTKLHHEGSWRVLKQDSLHSRRHFVIGGVEQKVYHSRVLLDARVEEQSSSYATNTALATGQRYQEYGAGLRHPIGKNVLLLTDLTQRTRQVLRAAADWGESSTSDAYRNRLQLKQRQLTGELDWSHRRTRYESGDSSNTVRDLALLKLNHRTKKAELSLLYGAESALVRDRVTQYVRVDSLQGDFSPDPFRPGVFVPDPDGSWVAVSYDTGAESVVASVELELTQRFKFGGPAAVSTESRMEIRDLARPLSPTRLYLLDPGTLQGDSTLHGEIRFRQDLNWRGPTAARWRIRYLEERILDNRQLTSPRKDKARRYSLRRKWRGRKGANSRYRLQLERRRQSSQNIGTNDVTRDILSHALESAWNQELPLNLAAGLKVRVELGRDRVLDLGARTLKIDPLLEWRSGSKGNLRVDGSWQKTWSDATRIPFELLQGARVGLTSRLGAEFRYRIGRQTSFTMSWRMDRLPERAALHTGRVQIQSFF